MRDPTLTLAAYAGLERALNAALKIDATIPQKLIPFEGRVIRLECTAPSIVSYVCIGQQCSVLHTYEGAADVGLAGDLQSWIELAAVEDKAAALINSSMIITGDSRILMELGDIGGQLDIDWESRLAEFVGDVPAHLANRVAKKSMQLGKEFSTQLQQQLHSFIFDEAQLVPKKSETDAFYNRLRQLEMRIERVQANSASLAKTASSSHTHKDQP